MENQTIADILSSLGNKVTGTTKTESKFENHTMYFNDIYIGNYSMPDNFSDVTKASVTQLFDTLGIKLLVPGSTKKDIDFSAFGLQK